MKTPRPCVTTRFSGYQSFLAALFALSSPPVALAQMWAGLGEGTNGLVRTLAYDGLFVYVGGNFSDGNLVVAGQFQDAGACGSPCSDTDRIAIWQPLVGEWVPVDKGFGNNVVSALAFAPAVSLSKTGSTGKTAINVDILVAGGSLTMDGNGNSLEQVAQLQVELPVELTAFDAIVDRNDVFLSWSTASELSNSGFVVQHQPSTLGEWNDVGFVERAGTTNEPEEHRFTVSDLTSGTHRFRLKQIDYDGAFEFSAVVEVSIGIPGTHSLTDAFPNPFNPQSIFALTVSREQSVRIDLK